MKHVAIIVADYHQELETKVEAKLQELQIAGNEIVDISLGGRGAESERDWIALILYENAKD